MKTLLQTIGWLSLFLLTSCSSKTILSQDEWLLKFDKSTRAMTVSRNGAVIADGLYAAYRWQDTLVSTAHYKNFRLHRLPVDDGFGSGTVFRITFTKENLPTLVQSFYVYKNRKYILTDFTLVADKASAASNYMAPVNLDRPRFLTENIAENRALFIPFDNDCWVRYKSHPLTFDTLVSYEVSSVFNPVHRNGWVIGSVEHDNWKTAVEIHRGSDVRPAKLVCYGGVADRLTRDSKNHGFLVGKQIKSPKIFIGYFDDWRNGLEEFGKANAIVAPAKSYDRPVPFGWNSWGVLQFDLTYRKALEVSDYFKEHLQDSGFSNGHALYIGLDSGWNRFTEKELKNFVEKCKSNGQIAGIYWTPFTDWGKKSEARLPYASDFKYGEVYLYANGKPQELDNAYALDPTHPAVEQQMKEISALFRRCGFEYVKMDFMTHGCMEADKWYNPAIKTGMQAYNYGMALLDKYFGHMYINLSISPLFPAQYAQSRRIACDAWNKIKDTEYTLNALSYGWWLDNIYRFNDADHVVLKGADDGENRARITSAVITGLFIAGDDFSREGCPEGKSRSIKYLTNRKVNSIATGKSFRPVEGNAEHSENQFVRQEENGDICYAVFNYTDRDTVLHIPVSRIGLDPDVHYTGTDVWKNEKIDLERQLLVPAKDVRLIRIDHKI